MKPGPTQLSGMWYGEYVMLKLSTYQKTNWHRSNKWTSVFPWPDVLHFFYQHILEGVKKKYKIEIVPPHSHLHILWYFHKGNNISHPLIYLKSLIFRINHSPYPVIVFFLLFNFFTVKITSFICHWDLYLWWLWKGNEDIVIIWCY